MRKALIDAQGHVLNVIEIEAGANWSLPIGCQLIDAPTGGSPGDTWDGSQFIRPTPVITLVAVPHWAKVSAFNVAAVKPLEVKRTYRGKEFIVNCYITQSLKDQYQGEQLIIGDFVIIEFVDGDLDKPLAIAKVFKTW